MGRITVNQTSTKGNILQHHTSTCYILNQVPSMIFLEIFMEFYLFDKEVDATDDECQCVDKENIDRCYDRHFFLDDFCLSVSPCLFMETKGNSVLA